MTNQRPDPEPLAAEVFAEPRREREAAQALQRLGFRVLHIGTTISVDAPQSLWEKVFGVAFEEVRTRSLEVLPETGFKRPVVPSELKGLVTDVSFQQPPKLM
jgi:hypothetical protein